MLRREPLYLIATHYRVLISLAEQATGIVNLHVSRNGYTIKPGPSADYNAIEVMGEQGVPEQVLERAHRHLDALRAKRLTC